MDKIKTGEIIRKARIAKGYTQLELGDIVGVTNKAVSRWENGDSFPDISQLDSLASALDLKIEEIVQGEQIQEASSASVSEIVRMAKIQGKQKFRNNLFVIIGSVFVFALIIYGYNTFINYSWEWSAYLGPTLLIVEFGLILFKVRMDRSQSFLETDKIGKLILGVSSVLYVGIIVLFFLLISIAKQEGTFFTMPLVYMGPFLHKCFGVIYILNLAFVIYLVWHHVFNERPLTIGLYTSIATCHLSLMYTGLLYGMDAIETVGIQVISDTVFVTIGIVVALLIAACLKKYNVHR